MLSMILIIALFIHVGFYRFLGAKNGYKKTDFDFTYIIIIRNKSLRLRSFEMNGKLVKAMKLFQPLND